MKSDQWKMAFYWFLPGVLIGAFAMGFYLREEGVNYVPTVDDMVAMEKEDGSMMESKKDSSNSIIVGNQPAGYAVIVEHAELSETNWIAVRERDEAGNLGNILGALRRDAGAHDRLVVDLLRATEPDHEYAVVLYTDDGDKAFDSKKDTEVTDADGNLIMSTFRALIPVGPSGR